MFSGLTNQVNSWMNKKQEDDILKTDTDVSKEEEIVKNAEGLEKKESR